MLADQLGCNAEYFLGLFSGLNSSPSHKIVKKLAVPLNTVPVVFYDSLDNPIGLEAGNFPKSYKESYLPEVFQQRRLLLGYTPILIERRTGIKAGNYVAYEKGQSDPTVKAIGLISSALKMTPCYLPDPIRIL